MKLTLTLFGLMVGLVAGFYVAVFGIDFILSSMLDNVAIVISICAIAFALVTAIFLSAERLLEAVFGIRPKGVAETISEALNAAINSIPGLDDRKRSEIGNSVKFVSAVYANIVLRSYIFRAFILVAVATSGTIATYVLLKQNQILEQQTERFDVQNSLLNDQIERLALQNELLQTQALMQEANRYSAYSAIVTNMVGRIYKAGALRAGRFDVTELSDDFVTEIKSLLAQLGPYTYVQRSQSHRGIATVYLSPERGHILRALIENNVNFYDFSDADFSFSDMRNLSISTSSVGFVGRSRDFPCGTSDDPQVDFRQIDLRNTDWSGTTLGAVMFTIADNMKLQGTSLIESIVEIGSTEGLDLSELNLENSRVMSQVPVSLDGLRMSTQMDYLLAPCVGAVGDNMSQTSVGAVIDPVGFKLFLYGYANSELDVNSPDWAEITATFDEEGFEGLGEVLESIHIAHANDVPLPSNFVLEHLLGHMDLDHQDDWRGIYSRDPKSLIARVSEFSVDNNWNISVTLEIENSE